MLSLANIKSIIQILQKTRSISIDNWNYLKKFEQQGTFLQIIEQGKEYQVEIISLLGYDGFLCQDKLNKALEQYDSLKQLESHPYFLKCIENFIIQDHLLFKFERTKCSLNELINSSEKNISRSIFLKISSQIIEAVIFLHKNQLNLGEFNPDNIYLDKQDNIKIVHIKKQLCQQHQLKQLQSQNSAEKEDTDVQEKDDQEQQKINNLQKQDLFKVGYILFFMAGGDQEVVKQSLSSISTENLIKKLNIDQDIQDLIEIILNPQKKNQSFKMEQILELFNHLQDKEAKDNNQEKNIFVIQEEQIFNNAVEYFEQQRFSLCLSIFKQLQKYHRNNDKYHAWLGRCYIATQQQMEGQKWSQSALKINPNNGLAFFNLGNIYSDLLNDDAIKYYKKSLEFNPQSEKIYFNLGVFYGRKNMQEEAIKSYQDAIQINPNYYSAYNNLGSIFETINKFNPAIKCFKKAIQIAPQKEEAYNNLGVTYYNKKDFEKSIKYFKKAYSLKPQSQKYKQNLLISKSYQ
ncbi:hypothetical protein ABPG74_019629 [Tetrahymena malaccensis]